MSNQQETQGEQEQFMDYIELGEVVTDKTEIWDGQGGGGPAVGTYEFEVLEAKSEQSSTGKPCINVKFQVVTEGDENGKTCRGWYYRTEKAVGRLLNLLAAAGVPLDERNGFSIQALVGAHIIASIVENSYTEENPLTKEKTKKTNTRLQQESAVPKAPPKAGARPANGSKPAAGAVPAAARR